MRVVFAGTPPFAATILEALIPNANVVGVFSQPDRQQGRGRHLTPSPVKQLAQQHSIPVFTPASARTPEFLDTLSALSPDIMIVAAYGLILPTAVLSCPKYGCVNLHASLLPQYRGASPISASLLAGDATTGITVMCMDEGMDTGDMLHKVSLPIHPADTTEILTKKLSQAAAGATVETLKHLSQYLDQAEPQDHTQATYAPKIKKTDAIIDWNDSAEHIERMVRAYQPWPGANTTAPNGEIIKIQQAYPVPDKHAGAPGTIIDIQPDGLLVKTGAGCLQITHLQRPNKPAQAMSAIWHACQAIWPKHSILGTS